MISTLVSIKKYVALIWTSQDRFIDKEKEGWEDLKKELHFYNDKYFWLGGDYTEDKKIEISKIEIELREQIDSYDRYNK